MACAELYKVETTVKVMIVANKMQDGVLRVGFVPLADCAPLVMAQETGIFARHGLRISLSRELGWATVRDKVVYGELDAAHALAPMPLVAALGLGSVSAECIASVVTSLEGNGITVSKSLAEVLKNGSLAFRNRILSLRNESMLTFGVTASFSSHRHLMRMWLSQQGVDPERDVRVVVVPPQQMASNLKAGHLDGFCAGEPWSSVAEAAQCGVCVATSRDLDAGHPEKILMMRNDFAAIRREECIALSAALIESCEWCADARNHSAIQGTLARPEYVGVPSPTLARGIGTLCVFPNRHESEPSAARAAWSYELVRASGFCVGDSAQKLSLNLARTVFRSDLHEAAVNHLNRLKLNTKSNENETKPEIIHH